MAEQNAGEQPTIWGGEQPPPRWTTPAPHGEYVVADATAESVTEGDMRSGGMPGGGMPDGTGSGGTGPGDGSQGNR
ncbi:MAG: hypothetical protein GEU98_16300 [Pseudonocardiaceae bacterium]|nr:hypothetical protein [Pseudonocardiaceae bacterium]